MRNNQPVSQREYDFPAHETLLSTTDTSSHITYANAAFIRTSGFDLDELMGQPHNLVRHPDMPPEAYADMWRSLKEGQSWTALVKRRRPLLGARQCSPHAPQWAGDGLPLGSYQTRAP